MATNPNRRAGIASLSINGVAYDVVSDLSYMPNKVKRETLIGQSGVQGYSEMPMAGFISATIRDAGSLAAASLNDLTNATLVLVLANGKVVSGDNMWCTDFAEVKTQDATFSVKFEGSTVYEQTT